MIGIIQICCVIFENKRISKGKCFTHTLGLTFLFFMENSPAFLDMIKKFPKIMSGNGLKSQQVLPFLQSIMNRLRLSGDY